jgi:hypothetical protein
VRSQKLSLGDFSTSLRANYDYNANRDFVKDVVFSGDLVEGGADDVSVSYEVTHDFGDKNTNVKLTAQASGTTFGAEYDQNDGVTEVSAERDLDVGDQKVNVQPSWQVKSKTARVKLMSKLGGDSINAQIDYDIDGGEASLKEVSLDHHIEDGRDVSATFSPGSSNLKVDYVDKKVDSGATWTATATVPLEDRNNIVDSASLKLKRAWSW